MAENGSPPVRVVLLQLEDTLVPWQTLSHWQWAWRPRGPVLSERHARAALRRQLHLWDRRRWQALVGRAPAPDVAAYRGFLAETLTAIAGHPLPDAESLAVVERFLKPAHEAESFPDAFAAVRALEGRGAKVGAISDLPAENARLALRRAGLPESLLVMTGDAPDPRPPMLPGYRAVAKQLGGKTSHGWYVGDQFWSGVRAAARAGFTSVLLDRSGAADEVLETRIRSLAEVAPLLDAPPSALAPSAGATGPDDPDDAAPA